MLKNIIRDLEYTAAGILLISACLSLFMFRYGNLTYYGDAGTYLQYAQNLPHFYFPDGLYYRTPTYPLLIVLSGYLLSQSFSVLLAMQALCAALIPLITYQTLLPVSRKLACIAAFVMMFTLLPFIFQLTIYPDQLHIFLSLLFSLGCVRCYLAPDSTKNTIFLYGVLFFLSFSRPTVIVFVAFPLVILGLSKFAAKKRQAMVHAVCLLAILGAHWIVAEKKQMDAAANHRIVRSFSGKQIFYNVYFLASAYDKPFARENGPATARFRDTLEAFFQNKGEGDYTEAGTNRIHAKKEMYLDWRHIKEGDARYNQIFAPYLGDPALMADQLLTKPNKFAYLGVITDIADFVLGVEGDRLLRDMAIEQIRAQPGILLDLLKEQVWPFYWLPNWDDEREKVSNIGVNLLTYVALPEDAAIRDLSERVQYQITTRYFTMDDEIAQKLTFAWLAVLALFLRGCLVVCAVAVVICIGWGLGRKPLPASTIIFMIAFILYVGQSLPIAFLADVAFRYQAAMGILLIPTAAAACAVIYDFLRQGVHW